MNKKYLDQLVCPISKGRLIYHEKDQELISKQMRLAFPIRDGIPILLTSQARALSQEEYDALP